MKPKTRGYWTPETISGRLIVIKNKIGRAPTRHELIDLKEFGMICAINRLDGWKTFDISISRKRKGYWTEDTICDELKKTIEKIGHFPVHKELSDGLRTRIHKLGGTNYFREKMGYKLVQNSPGHWTQQQIIEDLNIIMKKQGKFPTSRELTKLNRYDLRNAIRFNGGFIFFRKLLNIPLFRHPPNTWDDGKIINELKEFMVTYNIFPSSTQLQNMGMSDLGNAITLNGGYVYFREQLGIQVSDHEKFVSEQCSYFNKRGRKSELLIKRIILDYCNRNGLSHPCYNKKFLNGNIIEFVCTTNKTIGIDVTNTKSDPKKQIQKKYTKRNYHNYLDELWIVAFSNILTNEDYVTLNNTSPDNVKIMSVDTFINEIGYLPDKYLKKEIESYKKCTFHTKDECTKLMNMDKQNIDYWSSQKYMGI